MSKSVIIKKHGGPEVLEISDINVGSPSKDEIKIKNISYSFNTLQSYTSYKFSIPNDEIKIKETGNYKVSIYDSFGDKVLEKRFTVINKMEDKISD